MASQVMRWLRNNISAILVGLVLTIFGAALGYYISEKQPSVSWTTKTQIIFSHENADTSLRVLDSSGSEIKQDVFFGNFGLELRRYTH
jgi:hypothetical protein